MIGDGLTRLSAAFLKFDDRVHRRRLPRLAFPRQPMHLNAIHLRVLTQTEMNPWIVGGQITAIAVTSSNSFPFPIFRSNNLRSR